MAAEDGEGLRVVVRVSIDDRDLISKKGEAIGGREAGWASTKNDDGLSGGRCHDIRERIHTAAATASRRLVESLARGPNI
jgi:hypothetical protein